MAGRRHAILAFIAAADANLLARVMHIKQSPGAESLVRGPAGKAPKKMKHF